MGTNFFNKGDYKKVELEFYNKCISGKQALGLGLLTTSVHVKLYKFMEIDSLLVITEYKLFK